jgi:hypothetical protein
MELLNSASSKNGRISPIHNKTWSEMGLFLISNPNLEIKKNLTNLLRTIQKFQNFSDHQSFSLIDQQTLLDWPKSDVFRGVDFAF